MQYLRLLLMITFVSGWLHSANGAALFGGPKTIPDDGTWSPSSDKFSNPGGGECQVTCNSTKGYIQVDIETRCMCISQSGCFKVDIGQPGLYTSNGLGRMGAIQGGRLYSTKPGKGNASSFDYDGVSMGIASNTAYGKWIHKARDCQGGGQSTQGCIGVPCAMWPEVKALALEGKSVQVCNGKDYPTSRKCPGGGPCYKDISPSAAAKDRAGLYVPKKSGSGSGDSSGEGRGQTR